MPRPSAGLGFSVGAGAGRLHVSIGTFTDPAGLIYGTVLGTGNVTASGQTTGLLSYAYSAFGPTPASVNARDYAWGQNYGTNASTNPALDTPWNGSVFDLGGAAHKAVVFPVMDHGPLPPRSTRVHWSISPTLRIRPILPIGTGPLCWKSTCRDGSRTTLRWQTDSQPCGLWRIRPILFATSQSREWALVLLLPYLDTEDEIDAVAGLTAEGRSVGNIPEPETYAMLLAGLGVLGFAARRRKQRAA